MPPLPGPIEMKDFSDKMVPILKDISLGLSRVFSLFSSSFFFPLFFSYIHMSSLLIFILLIGGKLIFQHFWSRFVTFVNAEPC